jgi:RNA-directed DNA polymerase
MKVAKATGAKGSHSSVDSKGQQNMEEPLMKTRVHDISMERVRAAFLDVKANGGAAGVDGETIQKFEENLDDNLYKIWNRMSSGSYMPPAVRAVKIPKADGVTMRKLGIPSVSDRVAQAVAKMYLEPVMEPAFHPDSYGFRPNRSQRDALETTRKRCFEYDWVIDLDIKAFFDTVDHELILNVVRKHAPNPWITLYVERWIRARIQESNGEISERNVGTPQGGVVSPLLANMYLHHAFDEWMKERHPYCPFERFADDIVIHCRTESQAQYILSQIRSRLDTWKLELHPVKTRIVYCKDTNRNLHFANTSFDFLGFTFQQRKARGKFGLFAGFTPAMSQENWREKSKQIRDWQLQRRTNCDIGQLAKICNDEIRGWTYFAMFGKAKFLHMLLPINFKLVKWAQRKYRLNKGEAWNWIAGIQRREPNMFTHWKLGLRLSV